MYGDDFWNQIMRMHDRMLPNLSIDENGVLKAKRELFDWIEVHNDNPVFLFNVDNPYLEKLHRESDVCPGSRVR